MSSELVALEAPSELLGIDARLPAVFLVNAKASKRFWKFFAVNIRNQNTRRAYYRAACRFSDRSEGRKLFDLSSVEPLDVAALSKGCRRRIPKVP